ncbi:MAG: hypothetical protein ACREVS_09120 [Burkholderiales bacterium]
MSLRATTITGSVWRRVLTRLRPAPIATADALKTFLEERASLIAQKCAIDYCRGKTGLASYALFTEKPFLEALDVCRWEAFVAVLGDLFIVAEGHLRPQVSAEQHPRLCEALVGLHSAALAALPAPAHRPEGWGEASASFALRFKTASLGKPQQALDVADHSAKRLFETLPIHASMRALDEEVVYGAVRFRMIAVSQEMQRRFAAADLARQLLA